MPTRRKIVRATIADDGADVAYAVFGPADDTGKQTVADTLTFDVASIPIDRLHWFCLYGLSQVVSNQYNKLPDDATPATVRQTIAATLDAVRENTWTPGRSFAERDPTDLELAMAEAMGRDVREVMDHVENDVQRDDAGNPKLDKRGRMMRVFTQRTLDSIAEDPAVKPIYARIVAERAKRLQAEAKKGGGTSKLSGLFGPAPAPATAAPEPDATVEPVAAQ